jgi:hypothetical protein
MGRARALEVMLGADDYDAELAEMHESETGPSATSLDVRCLVVIGFSEQGAIAVSEGGENIPSSRSRNAGRSRTIFPIVPRKVVCSLSPFSVCYLSWKRAALRVLHANSA